MYFQDQKDAYSKQTLVPEHYSDFKKIFRVDSMFSMRIHLLSEYLKTPRVLRLPNLEFGQEVLTYLQSCEVGCSLGNHKNNAACSNASYRNRTGSLLRMQKTATFPGASGVKCTILIPKPCCGLILQAV